MSLVKSRSTIVGPATVLAPNTTPSASASLLVNGSAAGSAPFAGVLVNVGASSTAQGLRIVGSFSGGGTVQLLEVRDNSNSNGANVLISGNGGGSADKYVRVSTGILQVINHAYTATLFSVTDAGAVGATKSPLVSGATQVGAREVDRDERVALRALDPTERRISEVGLRE